MKRSKKAIPPWLTEYQSKPMPHVYTCSVCNERSRSGRRRLTKDGITFICGKCLRKALNKARLLASERERLLKAENTIRGMERTQGGTP